MSIGTGARALERSRGGRDPRSRDQRDPLALMLGTGDRWDLVWIAIAVALSLHGAMVGPGVAHGILHDMRVAVDDNRGRLHEYFWRMYDVEVDKPKDEPKPEPPPPPPPPEPEPAPKPMAKAPVEDDPYKNLPPPAPAQAGHILAADKKADDPPELPGFVDGTSDSDFGARSAAGTSDKPTMARNASLAGVPGGKGTAGPVASAAPAEDKSRPVGLGGSASWNCPFPPEADADQIDQAVVGVQVTVRPDGSAQAAQVVSDPGHGFGRMAKQCALAKRYQPALDRSGAAILGSGLVNVRFSR